ncbi:MAG: Membrane-associated zinc metalloprotease, partial [uncultured Gemmatimonadaceae bacterium]
ASLARLAPAVRHHRLRPRARALPRGEVHGRLRAPLLHRLRPRAPPQAVGRDRVRAGRASARRLRAHGVAHRRDHVVHRGRGRGGGGGRPAARLGSSGAPPLRPAPGPGTPLVRVQAALAAAGDHARRRDDERAVGARGVHRARGVLRSHRPHNPRRRRGPHRHRRRPRRGGAAVRRHRARRRGAAGAPLQRPVPRARRRDAVGGATHHPARARAPRPGRAGERAAPLRARRPRAAHPGGDRLGGAGAPGGARRPPGRGQRRRGERRGGALVRRPRAADHAERGARPDALGGSAGRGGSAAARRAPRFRAGPDRGDGGADHGGAARRDRARAAHLRRGHPRGRAADGEHGRGGVARAQGVRDAGDVGAPARRADRDLPRVDRRGPQRGGGVLHPPRLPQRERGDLQHASGAGARRRPGAAHDRRGGEGEPVQRPDAGGDPPLRAAAHRPHLRGRDVQRHRPLAGVRV